MSRHREISPDFWTWEAVIDGAPMSRLYDLDYNAIVDWDRLQRVGERAKCRVPGISEMDQGLTRYAPAAGRIENHRNPPPTSRAEDITNHRDPPARKAREGTGAP